MDRFLNESDNDLDYGYSLPLKQEALAQGDIARAIDFLQTATIQKEINGIVEHGEACSLDAERKIAQDRKLETVKVTNLPSFSRNTIIKRYRVARNHHIQAVLNHAKHCAKRKYMSYTALAAQEQPQLVSRPRGKLWWEKDVPLALMQAKSFSGDTDAFKRYVVQHKERLLREAKLIREQVLLVGRERTCQAQGYPGGVGRRCPTTTPRNRLVCDSAAPSP